MTREEDRFRYNNLQLIDFSEEDDYLIAFPYRDSLEDLRLSVSFDNVNGRMDHVQSATVDARRQSFLRKSLAWDSAFFTSAGVLNHEELFLINKGFKKAESNQPSPRTQSNAFSCKKMMNTCPQNKVKSVRAPKGERPNPQGTNCRTKTRTTDHQIVQDKISSLSKLSSSRQTNNNAAVEGSNNAKMETKTRKAGTPHDLTVSKRSRSGDLSGLPKSSSFTSPTTEKNSKLHCSYDSTFSASSSKTISKSTKRKVNPKNMKPVNSPSSVHFPLSSTCSSNTSPASSIDGWNSESLSSTTIPIILDFQSQNSEERKFASQNTTRSSLGTGPFSGGPKRKIKPSGLRMPSPKIGFFDEGTMFNRSMQDRFGGRSPSSNENDLNKLLLKSGGHTPREILKMSLERKRQKDDRLAEKENLCSFEDQVNGLSRQLEVIDLADAVEHSTPITRTPLAKKNGK